MIIICKSGEQAAARKTHPDQPILERAARGVSTLHLPAGGGTMRVSAQRAAIMAIEPENQVFEPDTA